MDEIQKLRLFRFAAGEWNRSGGERQPRNGRISGRDDKNGFVYAFRAMRDLQERSCSLLCRPSPCQQHVFRKAGIIAVDKLAAGLATPDSVANPRSLCLTQVRVETGASLRRGCYMRRYAQVDRVLFSRGWSARFPTAIGIRTAVPSSVGEGPHNRGFEIIATSDPRQLFMIVPAR